MNRHSTTRPDPERPDPTTDSRPSTPFVVRAAFRLWMVAVGAGLFEVVVEVFRNLDHQTLSSGSIVAGVAIRLMVFTIALRLAGHMSRGSRRARTALTLLLGVIGLGSLLIGPFEWLVSGHHIADLAPDTGAWLFGTSRVVHIVAVVTATALMFRPHANNWFKTDPRALAHQTWPRATSGPEASSTHAPPFEL